MIPNGLMVTLKLTAEKVKTLKGHAPHNVSPIDLKFETHLQLNAKKAISNKRQQGDVANLHNVNILFTFLPF